MKLYKRILCCLLIVFTLFISGCGANDHSNNRYEYEEMEVVVSDIQRVGNPLYRKVIISLENEEYNLKEDLIFDRTGIFLPNRWNHNKGDVLTVNVRVEIDDTGEIVGRKIVQIL